MRRVILIIGGLIAALTVALVASGLWLIDSHKKHLNRLRTEKARETKLNKLKYGENGIKTNAGTSREEVSGEEVSGEEASEEEASGEDPSLPKDVGEEAESDK